MIQKLKNKLESLHLFISPTTTDKRQFEANIKNEFVCEHLNQNIKTLERHFGHIGESVFQYQKNISVITFREYKEKENEDIGFALLNPIEKVPFIYSIDDFEIFQNAYLRYQIEYFSKDLIERSLYQNSTNPFTNLEFQWITESKQELIKFFKDILDE